MIFVAVGTQLPFDRLIQAVDRWAGAVPGRKAFAQIGHGTYEPQQMAWCRFTSTDEFQVKTREATAVVAHAGMGTILSALELGKPVVVLPRLAEFGEHRNDHQLATANRFGALGMVRVASNGDELIEMLNTITAQAAATAIPARASCRLIDNLRSFIAGNKPSLVGGRA